MIVNKDFYEKLKNTNFVGCCNFFKSFGSRTSWIPYFAKSSLPISFYMPCYFWSEFGNSAHSGLQSALHLNLAIRSEFRIELDVLSIYSKICP